MACERHGPMVLDNAFEELALALGGVVATHAIPEDAVWDLARVIDHVHRKAQAAMSTNRGAADENSGESSEGMHPAIVHLVRQLRGGRVPR